MIKDSASRQCAEGNDRQHCNPCPGTGNHEDACNKGSSRRLPENPAT